MQVFMSNVQRILQYFVVFIFATLCFLFITNSFNHTLTIPYRYDNDALFAASWVKSIIDNGWYFTNKFLGAPNGYNMALFPMADSFNFFLLKLLTFYSKNYAVVYNLFYLLSFPTITISCLYVFRKLGLQTPFAVAGSVLFAFLPYHFLHSSAHLFLSLYYVIPLTLLIAIKYIPSNESLAHKKIWYLGLFLFCIITGSSGVYYAFFGSFFILCSAFMNAVMQKRWLPIFRAAVLVLVIFSTVVLNGLPYFLSDHEATDVAIRRAPLESEVYALKITPLLLPISEHRFAPFADLRRKYDATSIHNAGINGALGIMGDIGFVYLLLLLLVRPFSTQNVKTIDQVARLNLLGLLFGTMGGLGALFAYTITPMIRCYDRMSIYIGFFSLFGFFYLAQAIIQKKVHNKLLLWFFAILFLSFGLYDQVSSTFNYQNLTSIKDQVLAERHFVKRLERYIPEPAIIFQLPYTQFPEGGNYDLFKPYLYSKHLSWSFGAMAGQSVDLWQKEIGKMPITEMVPALIKAGIRGLYIDRSLIPNHAKGIEAELLINYGIKPVIVSQNGVISFFDLNQVREKMELASNAKKPN